MRLLAFEGLRYTGKAGEAGDLAAPPYDQVNDAARDRFHAASPYQFVHLTRPVVPARAAGDPFHYAADLYRRWLADGIVARDAAPSLYPYIIRLAAGGHRLGVMALVGHAPPSVIRPHEQTLDKPLAERLALLEATHADLEPALLLAEDDGRLDALLAADFAAAQAAGRAPLVDYRDDDGNHHLLFRIDDPSRITAYQQAVANQPAAIADGHHRFKVSQRFAEAHRSAPGTAAAAKMAVVTSMQSDALTIDPIHRALRQPIDPSRLAALRRSSQPFRPTGTTSTGATTTGATTTTTGSTASADAGNELARAVAEAPQPALGVWVAGQSPEIWLLDNTAAAATAGAAGPAPLVVEIFQNAILPALGLQAEAATDGTLVYRSNPAELYDQVAQGTLGTGFWLPPMLPAEFAAAIAQGAMLPPKSTRFLPKAMSGLVWSDHDSRVI